MRRFGIVGALVVAMVLAYPAGAAASRWSIETTKDPGTLNNYLHGISCPSATACIAVGEYLTPSPYAQGTLAERWKGTKWSVQSSPNPSTAAFSQLNGVSCTSTKACIAVGYWSVSSGPHLPLAERWNGTKWSIQKTPNPNPSGTGTDLNGVSCTAPSACTAVGDYRNGSNVAVTLAERWNGTKWAIEHTPNPKGSFFTLNGVSCASLSACTAVGTYANVADTINKPLAERWNGSKWSIESASNSAHNTYAELLGVSCTSVSACTAVGDYSTNTAGPLALAERWNGTKWSLQTVSNPMAPTSTYLYGVSCASSSACMAVGNYSAGAGYSVLAERWHRGKWSKETPPEPLDASSTSDSYLRGVSCTSTKACTAAGDYYSTTNAELTLAESWSG